MKELEKLKRTLAALTAAALLLPLAACSADTENAQAILDALRSAKSSDGDAAEETAQTQTVYLPASETYEYTSEDGTVTTSAETYTYDAQTRTLLEIDTDSDGETYTVQSTDYNAYGEAVLEICYSYDQTISSVTCYSYDEAGNQTEYVVREEKEDEEEDVEGRLGDASRVVYTYDEDGNCTEVVGYLYGAAEAESKITYSYDEDGNCTELISYDETGAIQTHITYRCDANGSPVEWTITDSEESQTYTCENTYDEQGQLTERIQYDVNGKDFRYVYSGENLIRLDHYDEANEDLITWTETFTYDANGNEIKDETIYYDENGETGRRITIVYTWQAVEFLAR